MGGWTLVRPKIESGARRHQAQTETLLYVGRPPRPRRQPACRVATSEQAYLVDRGLGSHQASNPRPVHSGRHVRKHRRSGARRIRHRSDGRKVEEKVGDPVKVDEPLLELETDKVTLEVLAPAAGALSEIPQGGRDRRGRCRARHDRATARPHRRAPKAAALRRRPAAPPNAGRRDRTARPGRAQAGRRRKARRRQGGRRRRQGGRLTKGDVLGLPGRARQDAIAPVPPRRRRTAAPHRARAPPAGAREERVRMTRLRQPHRRAAEAGAEHRGHAHHLQRGGHERGHGAARAVQGQPS